MSENDRAQNARHGDGPAEKTWKWCSGYFPGGSWAAMPGSA